MIDLLLVPLADAFLEVGVFVALLVAPFGYARWRWGDRLDAAMQRHARLGPLVAAAMTMPPGCGGAIIVMALYARGAVTFGAAIAALVATMGDASWVLLAAEPALTLQLKGLLLLTGALTGYLVDALRIAPRRRADAPVPAPVDAAVPAAVDAAVPASATTAASAVAGSRAARVTGGSWLAPRWAGLRAELRSRASVPRERLRTSGPGAVAVDLGLLPAVFWTLVVVGFALSLPVTFQLVDPAGLAAAVGGVDLYLLLGLAGGVTSVVFFVRGGCRLSDDTVETAGQQSLAKVFRHGAQEVAFVTVWVAVALVAWEVMTTVTGFDGSQLPLLGVLGVVLGALVGLIPGCGVQIVFAGLFLAGGMPLPTLVANTISQDGDALLPLLALERRSAVLATCITTVPALLVGGGLLLLT